MLFYYLRREERRRRAADAWWVTPRVKDRARPGTLCGCVANPHDVHIGCQSNVGCAVRTERRTQSGTIEFKAPTMNERQRGANRPRPATHRAAGPDSVTRLRAGIDLRRVDHARCPLF
jgi:hypothetical protein